MKIPMSRAYRAIIGYYFTHLLYDYPFKVGNLFISEEI